VSGVLTKLDPKFEKKIEQMEVLLLHSVCGFHILFQNHEIKYALQNQRSLLNEQCPEQRKKVECLISSLVNCSGFKEKRYYLQSLDSESYSLVVQTYLEILDGALKNLYPHNNLH
jgi:hypothetical protein